MNKMSNFVMSINREKTQSNHGGLIFKKYLIKWVSIGGLPKTNFIKNLFDGVYRGKCVNFVEVFLYQIGVWLGGTRALP